MSAARTFWATAIRTRLLCFARNEHSRAVSLLTCENLHLGQHIFAEAAHFGEDRVGGVATKAEIDRDDAEVTQSPEIRGDRFIIAGAEPAVAVVGLLWDPVADLQEPIGKTDIRRATAGVVRPGKRLHSRANLRSAARSA